MSDNYILDIIIPNCVVYNWNPEYIQQLSYSEAAQYAQAAKKYLSESDIMSELKRSLIQSMLSKPKPKDLDIEGFRSRYPNQFKKVM